MDPEIANDYYNLGDMLSKQEKHEEAMQYYENAFSIDKHHFGSNHTRIATFYKHMGTLYEQKNNYDDAMKHF